MKMNRTTKIIAGAAIVGALAVGGATIAVASGSDDADFNVVGTENDGVGEDDD